MVYLFLSDVMRLSTLHAVAVMFPCVPIEYTQKLRFALLPKNLFMLYIPMYDITY